MLVRLINYTPNPDETCMLAAAVCRSSGASISILNKALEAGHDSLLEHASFTFEIKGISRACSHQLVRHRLASYSQQSQRHTELPKGYMWYVTPPHASPEYHTIMEVLRLAYKRQLEDGIPLEDARYLLPNATKTDLIMTANARSLHNFFALRCCERAQWEIRELANMMLFQCKRVAPVLFKHAGRQCKTCKEPCGKGDVING